MGRKEGAGLRSEVFLLSAFPSSGVRSLKARLGEGEEEQRCCLRSVSIWKCLKLWRSYSLGGNAAGGKL